MAILLFIYVIVGGASMITNFGKWLFNSKILALIFLPFMVVYFLINGSEQKRNEANTILKAGFLISILYLGIVGLIFLYKSA